jgi:hypothetical protein
MLRGWHVGGVLQAPEGAMHISVADGTGIPELKRRVKEMLAEVSRHSQLEVEQSTDVCFKLV